MNTEPSTSKRFSRWARAAAPSVKEFLGHCRVILAMIGVFWFLWIYDLNLPADQSLYHWGIQPMTWAGLPAIFAAPFVHQRMIGDEIPWHLFGNTLSFATLGLFVRLGGAQLFWRVFGVCLLTAGLGTWTFGTQDSYHYGASGIIFGFFGFLLVRGILQCSLKWTAVTVGISIIHAGIIYQLIPREGVSASAHLCGLLGGMAVGWHEYCYKRSRRLLQLESAMLNLER